MRSLRALKIPEITLKKLILASKNFRHTKKMGHKKNSLGKISCGENLPF
jgi:hypothetical protein